MSFFHPNLFQKKVPNRKIKNRPEKNEELINPQRSVKLSFGETGFLFSAGEWHNIKGKKSSLNNDKSSQLRTKIDAQEEMNNLLRLKYEVALNMLTQVTAENHVKEKENEKLQENK